MEHLTVSLLFALLLALTSSASSSCSSFSFSNNREYTTCVSLSQLNCFLHWTYHASTATADVAFRATDVSVTSTGNWVAWALNPTGVGMIGSQALVAFKNSNGSMSAYTSSVQTTALNTLTESPLSYTVSNLTVESSGSQIIIFATIQVPQNKTSANHVWQVGPLSGGSPVQHPLTSEHTSSLGTVNFLSGVDQGSIGSPQPAKMAAMSTPPQGSTGSSVMNKGNVGMFALSSLCFLAVL